MTATNTAAAGSEVRDCGDMGSGVVECDTQSIWNLRIFRRRYIIGILTNKANISI